MKALVLVVLLVTSVAVVDAAEAPVPRERYDQVPQLDPLADLTPAQATEAMNTLQQIQQQHQTLFPTGDQVNADLYKTVEGRRVQENLEYIQHYKAFQGGNEAERASTIYAGDTFAIEGEWRKSPRHMRDSNLIYPTGSFQIIEANGNLLDDFNRRLNKISNKLSHSKFACGEFDWLTQLKFNFKKAALEKYIDNLMESALAAGAMAFIANISPTLYEIIKWLRMNAGLELNADKVSCHQMEAALTDIGQRQLRGEGYAECVKANQNQGVAEAHRICNQSNSPWDGIENMAGKIEGLNADTGNINLTQVVSDRMAAGKPDDLTAAQRKQADAQDRYNQAQTNLAANPDPGDAPNAPNGSQAMIDWQRQKTAYVNAKREMDQATTNLNGAVAATNTAGNQLGPWSSLRNSLADNLGNILGNIDLSSKADIQFGRQRQYVLFLKLKHQAYKMSLDLLEQLQTHNTLITLHPDDRDDIKDSYEHIQAYCFGTMQAPWLNEPNQQLTPKLWSWQVRFGYDTMDRLAILWGAFQEGGAESLARTKWMDDYRYIECINTMMQFELYDYLWVQGQKDKDTVLSEFQNLLKQGGSERIIHAVEVSLDEYLDALKRKRDEQIPVLVQTIAAVNTFPLRSVRTPNQDADRTLTTIPGDETKWGR